MEIGAISGISLEISSDMETANDSLFSSADHVGFGETEEAWMDGQKIWGAPALRGVEHASWGITWYTSPNRHPQSTG